VNISYDLDDNVLLSPSIVKEYWLNTSGNFNFKITALREKHGISSREISSRISSVNSYIDFGPCSACSEKNIVPTRNRSRAGQVIENVYYHYFCASCRDKANAFCKTLSDGDRKIVWMRLAFKHKLWTKLDNDEMNFLKAVYYLRSWSRIYHEIIKLDTDYSFKVLFKLDKMNLICYDKNDLTGEIRLRLMMGLQDLIQQKRI
jgi:hypothetical protein